MKIEVAAKSDLSDIAALVNSTYRGDSSRVGWTTEADLFDGMRTSEESLRQELSTPDKLFLVLRNPNILGCVFLQLGYGADKRGCYLGMLSVHAPTQATGYGKLIMKAAEEKARDNNCSYITLRVLSPRNELMAWYERRGFRRTGEVIPFSYEKAATELPKRNDLEFVVFRKDL